MNGHRLKQCPRCLHEFDCHTAGMQACQCDSIALSDAHRDYIAARYDDCLCPSCLVELRRQYHLESIKPSGDDSGIIDP